MVTTTKNNYLFNKHTNVKDRLEAKYYQIEQPQLRVLISGLTKTEREKSLLARYGVLHYWLTHCKWFR